MTDPDDRPEPPGAADELATLTGFLDFLRATIAWKVDGLDDTGLRARLAPSTMSLGGMLHHLAFVEDHWFGHRLRGLAPAAPWGTAPWDADPDWDWRVADTLDAATLLARWRAAVDASRGHLDALLAAGAGLGDLERRAGPSVTVRWVLVHMIEEYARHAGHADLIRESLDGLVGE